jgi:hypothetical protein
MTEKRQHPTRTEQMAEEAGGLMLEHILEAAKQHGEQSEPEHEVGDLQGVLTACWKKLSADDKYDVYTLDCADLLDWLPEDEDDDER